MAGFRTHLTVSSIMGIGYGGAAWWFYHVPEPTCVLAGGLCAVSGMLPDIDSDSGRPLRESIAFAAAVVPMMLIDRLSKFNLATETIVLTGAIVYLIIRFGAAGLLKKITVHRGMLHSLPAAVIFGEIAFLLTSGEDLYLRYYKAGAVVLGYLSHLVLDEIYSIEWYRGRIR
ncbi:MAG: metal-dependent hydrolase, partial [Pirellulales bacterium]|nr:metal-dependent hydrolase [Pirellulales bacterium]